MGDNRYLNLPLKETPWPNGNAVTTCPICGDKWKPAIGSFLPCHARCLLTEETAEKVVRLRENPDRTDTLKSIAEHLKVPLSVVRITLHDRTGTPV